MGGITPLSFSLLFFFFVLLILCAVRGVNLHPMNYFFLAAAFFSFHLLLAYMADLLPFKLAFAIAAVVSCFLVVSYLRLVAGLRFAAVEAGLAQLVYLVLFSAAFFFEGATGLASRSAPWSRCSSRCRTPGA